MIEVVYSAAVAATIVGAGLVVTAGVYLFGRYFTRASVRDAELLDFLDVTGYSVQCLNGQWAVTNAAHTLVGNKKDTIREAIESAASGERNAQSA